MATIVSLSLARTPPNVPVENDDSPHQNTFQVANEKAISECSGPSMTLLVSASADNGPGDDNASIMDAIDNSSTPDEQQQHVSASGQMDEMKSGSPMSRDDPPSYLPAHLHKSKEPTPTSPVKEEEGHCPSTSAAEDGELISMGKFGGTLENGASKLEGKDLEAKPAGEDAPSNGHTTPTGYSYPHRRLPSSSIPHLLSNSITLSPEAQQLILQQLTPVGVGGATMLASPLRSREESFAFSVDGDDSAFKGIAPQTIRTSSNLAMINLKQGMVGSSCGSALSSFASLTSNVSAVNQARHQLDITPPPPMAVYSPLHKVPMPTTLVGSQQQTGLGMPQQPTLAVYPDSNSSSINSNMQQPRDGDSVARIQTAKLSGACPPIGLPLPNQQLLFTNQHPSSGGVQPVLYSAINSLERYNAASFDNKVMRAKARGTYGNQDAFPGVPSPSAIANKNASGLQGSLDSKNSSVDSAFRGRNKNSSGIETMGNRIQQKGTTDTCDSTQTETEVGVEQLVPVLLRQTSKRKVYKSKSSGNLSDNDSMGIVPETLEQLKAGPNNKSNRSVTIIDQKTASTRRGRRREKKKQPMGIFRPSSDAYTPRMGNRNIKYKPAQERTSVEKMSSTMGTIQRPNFRDALRRVAIILHQHIVKIEQRFSTGIRGVDDTGLFKASMREQFNEDNFATPRYKCSMVRVPMARPGVVYSMRKIRVVHTTPTTDEIYEFAHQLFKNVQLSSECSIVCLIYVEKLMEVAKVPLVAETWRPIFMAGLLLASKVWQDLSSWNIEFASVYPQFSLDAINRLELSFLKFIKWDLYISSRYVL